MPVTKQTVITPPWERFLTILAAVLCLIITILVWRSISPHQSMWPLPAVYFLEIVILSILSAFRFVRGDPHGLFLTWATVGVIGVFSILAALSVGVFYLPFALIFATISITSDVRSKKQIPAHITTFFLAAIAQFALILLLAAI